MAIQGLAVNITAETSQFKRGINSAQGELNKFAKQAKRAERANKALKTSMFAVGAAAATAFAAIGYGVAKELKTLDGIGKTADKLGLATEKLIGLQHAAEQTGVGSKTLDTALQRLTRRLSEAAQGGGPALKALDELGLSAEQLSRMPVDQAMFRIADAMEKVTVQSDRVRLAFSLFDSEGVALVNTLKGGSRQLKKFMTEAQQLGLTVSREDIKQVEKFNDAIGKIKAAFTGGFRQIIVAYSDDLEEFAKKLTRVAMAAKQFYVNFVESPLNPMNAPGASYLGIVARDLLEFETAMQKLNRIDDIDLAGDTEEQASKMSAALEIMVNKIKRTRRAIHDAELDRNKLGTFDLLGAVDVTARLNILKDQERQMLAIHKRIKAKIEGLRIRGNEEAAERLMGILDSGKTKLEGLFDGLIKDMDTLPSKFNQVLGLIKGMSDKTTQMRMEQKEAANLEADNIFHTAEMERFASQVNAINKDMVALNTTASQFGVMLLQSIPDSLEGDARKRVIEMIKKIREGFLKHGIQANDLKLFELLGKGADFEKVMKIFKTRRQTRDANKQAGLMDRAADIKESLLTNEQRLARATAEINKLKAKGLLTEEQAAKAIQKQKEQLKQIQRLQFGTTLNNSLKSIGLGPAKKENIQIDLAKPAPGVRGLAKNRAMKIEGFDMLLRKTDTLIRKDNTPVFS
jgi:hypothetical protein